MAFVALAGDVRGERIPFGGEGIAPPVREHAG
jgi:hypothetical protein